VFTLPAMAADKPEMGDTEAVAALTIYHSICRPLPPKVRAARDRTLAGIAFLSTGSLKGPAFCFGWPNHNRIGLRGARPLTLLKMEIDALMARGALIMIQPKARLGSTDIRSP
jgi:hypothetical protein